MSKRPLHPALRLVLSGLLSVVVLYLVRRVGRGDPQWLIGLAGAAAGDFVLLVPVLVRGDSWQKMVAGALLFLPCSGLVLAIYAVVSAL